MATFGQGVRLFLSSDNTNNPTKVIAAARSLQLHISCTLEDCSTKDTDSKWLLQQVTEVNYDISTSALVEGGDTIAAGAAGGQALSDIETIYDNGTPVKFKISYVNTSDGKNNRTSTGDIVSGSCLLTSLQISAQNRQIATYDAQLQGYGDYTVAN